MRPSIRTAIRFRYVLIGSILVVGISLIIRKRDTRKAFYSFRHFDVDYTWLNRFEILVHRRNSGIPNGRIVRINAKGQEALVHELSHNVHQDGNGLSLEFALSPTRDWLAWCDDGDVEVNSIHGNDTRTLPVRSVPAAATIWNQNGHLAVFVDKSNNITRSNSDALMQSWDIASMRLVSSASLNSTGTLKGMTFSRLVADRGYNCFWDGAGSMTIDTLSIRDGMPIGRTRTIRIPQVQGRIDRDFATSSDGKRIAFMYPCEPPWIHRLALTMGVGPKRPHQWYSIDVGLTK